MDTQTRKETATRLTQRARRKLDTAEKIRRAALALYSEKGYEGAHIRDIATAAGMSTGAVFASFESKEALFADILKRFCERRQKAAQASLKTKDGLTGLERLVAQCTFDYRFFITETAGARLWLTALCADRGQLWDAFVEEPKAWKTHALEGFIDAVPPESPSFPGHLIILADMLFALHVDNCRRCLAFVGGDYIDFENVESIVRYQLRILLSTIYRGNVTEALDSIGGMHDVG